MRRVAALPSACFHPSSLPTPLQEQIQQTLFRMALDQARTKFGQYAMVKARIGQTQAQARISMRLDHARRQRSGDRSSLPEIEKSSPGPNARVPERVAHGLETGRALASSM